MPINEKQRRFVELVHLGKDQLEAYKLAGYKAKSERASRSSASEILTNPDCKQYLKELQAESKKTAILSIEERQEYLSRVVTTPIGEINELSDLCVENTIGEGTSKFKKPDPLKAIAELNRMDGAYAPEKQEVQIKGIGDLIDEIQSK